MPLSDFILRMRRGLPWGLIGLGLALPAFAQECPGAHLSFRGSRWSPPLSERVREELRVELERAGLCGPGEASAQIAFVWEGQEPLGLSVSLGQGKLARTVARRLDLKGLPPDGLALVLAEVTGELLAEARAVVTPPAAPPPSVERLRPPPEPIKVVAAPPPPAPPAEPRQWVLGLGARAAGEGWSGGQLQGGADAVLRWSATRYSANALVGGRAALVQNAGGGAVHAQSFLFGLGAGFALLQRATWELEGRADVLGGAEWATAQPRAGWQSAHKQGWTVDGRAGAEWAWRAAGVRWAVAAGLDVPFRALALGDGFQTVESVSGVGAYCALGGAWLW